MRVKKGEFLVPDNFSNARIVPISPTICLFSQSENAVISEKEVAELNRLAIESSNEYFFARDLSKCPRELHALPPSNLDLMMEDWATRQYKLLEIS